jgi:hypothetical protein
MSDLLGWTTISTVSIIQNIRWYLAAFSVGMLLAGCNHEPPWVDSKKAVLRLPASTEDIWARCLRDEDFASLGRLSQLGWISFDAGWGNPYTPPVRFSDAGLATLASLELPHLTMLLFGHCTNITDASLACIVKMKTVTYLAFLACPRITDAGLRTLAGMPNLTDLDLRGCKNITDKGLQYLEAKNNWQRIDLGGCTRVSFEAVARLQQRCPNANIGRHDDPSDLEQQQQQQQ